MALKHLALAARDVAVSARFYLAYFGFAEGPGPGLLADPEGFVLAIHEREREREREHGNGNGDGDGDGHEEGAAIPSWFHFGFHLTRAKAVALLDRLRQDGVTLEGDPLEHLGDFVFFCRDPDGYLVEVRGTG